MIGDYLIYNIVTITTGIGIVTYFTYCYAKNKIEQYVSNQVVKKVNEISKSEEIKFKQFQNSPSAIILFDHGGKSHNLCIPFDQSKAKYMRRRDVYLVKDGCKIEITHKPGVPYLISAKEMGGNKIVVEKDGILLKEYGIDEFPKYLEDIDSSN